jgi:glycosyltransferase involved in cell wall biosynthesis
MKVLFISEVQWLSQVSRKHQLVRRLPDDWDVLFVSPINANAGENSFRERVDTECPRVRYASLPLPKPDSGIALVRALTGALGAVGGRALVSRARTFRPDVVVCSYIWAARALPALSELGVPVVYDCNDLHTEFYPHCPEAAERAFRSLIAGAAEVVSSSERLREVCGRGLVIGNGVDLEAFPGRLDVPLPRPVAESPLGDCERLVAYVGSVDDRVDFDVLGTLVEALSKLDGRTGLVCVGRVFAGAAEKAAVLTRRHERHVLFTGRAPYEELPHYLSHASVGIAPFVLDERTKAINPNKLYMYAAMEQNIVTTPFSDDVMGHEDLIYVAGDPASFAMAVEEALGDDERRRAVRERIAIPNSWDASALAFRNTLSRIASEGRGEA